MGGIDHLSIAHAVDEAGEAQQLGIPAVLLFGLLYPGYVRSARTVALLVLSVTMSVVATEWRATWSAYSYLSMVASTDVSWHWNSPAPLPPVDLKTGTIIKGDIEVQTEASLTALRGCLEAAGTTMENVVMVRIYAANSGFYGAINKVYAKHFPSNPPSRTFVPVASWPMEFDLEIEAIAVA